MLKPTHTPAIQLFCVGFLSSCFPYENLVVTINLHNVVSN